MQASSLGFDKPKEPPGKVSFRKRDGEPIDLSDQQQQRRASIELGMSAASHSSLFNQGAQCLPPI